MLVIGVAEQENPTSNPEAESDKRHAMYEDDVGVNLAFSALRCVDAAGAFGLDGFRQRILVSSQTRILPVLNTYRDRFTGDIPISRSGTSMRNHETRFPSPEISYPAHQSIFLVFMQTDKWLCSGVTVPTGSLRADCEPKP
jgi:hypothetical protein